MKHKHIMTPKAHKAARTRRKIPKKPEPVTTKNRQATSSSRTEKSPESRNTKCSDTLRVSKPSQKQLEASKKVSQSPSSSDVPVSALSFDKKRSLSGDTAVAPIAMTQVSFVAEYFTAHTFTKSCLSAHPAAQKIQSFQYHRSGVINLAYVPTQYRCIFTRFCLIST